MYGALQEYNLKEKKTHARKQVFVKKNCPKKFVWFLDIRN